MWSLDYVEVAVDSLGEDLDHVDTLTVNTETDTVQVCQEQVSLKCITTITRCPPSLSWPRRCPCPCQVFTIIRCQLLTTACPQVTA